MNDFTTSKPRSMRIDWDKVRQADSEYGVFSSLLEDRLRYWDVYCRRSDKTPEEFALEGAKLLWDELEPRYRRQKEEMQRRKEADLAEVELLHKRLMANNELLKSRYRAYVASNVALALAIVTLVVLAALKYWNLLPWE
ncbi:MAG: hypothetical protein K2K69_06930 [Muribaculaceae bacterium]|nr:hypothetical protein [Muribaculaceae bacterium]